MHHQNNHRSSPYTISGDVCYDNKLMANTTQIERRPQQESICLPLPEHDRNPTNLKPKRRLRMRMPYVFNAVIGIGVSLILILLEFGYIPQNKLGYYCKDPSISHDFNGDTVSMTLLLVGCVLGPLLVILAVETERTSGVSKTCAHSVWRWYKEFIVGVAFCLTFVELAKVIVGEHRPHFLKTCKPDTENFCKPGDFISDYKCTNTYFSNYLVTDSSRSFPSGHAAASVFIAVFCSVYIHYRLVARRMGSLFKPFLITLCILWALVCSLTRITDRRHHWWDVLIGTIVGVICATYVIIVFCNKFQTVPRKTAAPTRPTSSTTTLLDVKNKDSTSVII